MACPMASTSSSEGAVMARDGSRARFPISSPIGSLGSRPPGQSEQTRRGVFVADSAIAPYRLPRSVLPDRYELTLTPDLPGATFAGEERISIRVEEAVSQIVLNAIELEILTVELSSDDGHDALSGSVTYDSVEERITIDLDGVAAPGLWHLHLTFTGILNDKLHGFYRSRFKD